MDVRRYNRDAWDKNVARGQRWTVPVTSAAVNQARHGDFEIVLTPTRPVPHTWFPALEGTRTLCLAAGGGQQGPLLAAAGAVVTVYDNSPQQLAQDRMVAERDRLAIETVEGDMADLSDFADGAFGLIVHPCSNCFVPDVRAVWRECFRVLRRGGLLLSGFTNPLRYLFEDEREETGRLKVVHRIPYSDLDALTGEDRQRLVIDRAAPLEFGHTLEDQIGGQIDAGFLIAGFYEDKFDGSDPLSQYIATLIATRAIKP